MFQTRKRTPGASVLLLGMCFPPKPTKFVSTLPEYHRSRSDFRGVWQSRFVANSAQAAAARHKCIADRCVSASTRGCARGHSDTIKSDETIDVVCTRGKNRLSKWEQPALACTCRHRPWTPDEGRGIKHQIHRMTNKAKQMMQCANLRYIHNINTYMHIGKNKV